MPLTDTDINPGQHNNEIAIHQMRVLSQVDNRNLLKLGGRINGKRVERKKKMTKKLAMTVGTARRAVRNLALLAAVAVAIGAWADTETVGGYTWTYQINGDTAEIYGYEYWPEGSVWVWESYWAPAISPETTGAVTIPSTLGGKPVTSIGYRAFYNCSGLTSVTIGNCVTNIGSSAFNNCTNLTSMTIPNSVTNIGSYAFCNCTNLTSVTIGNGVTSIGSYAFYYCSGLTSVHITDLAKWCGISFGNCDANPLSYAHNLYLNSEKITDLVINDGVMSIGAYAFSGCSGLASVTIPDSVTSIGSYAFKDCSNLTGVSIPDSVTSIGTGAFVGCRLSPDSDGFVIAGSTLYSYHGDCSEVTVPDSVTTIWGMAFSNHVEITSLTIPNSVINIAEAAFYGCDNLWSLTVPYVPRGDDVWDGWYNTRSGLAFFFTKTAWESVITHYDYISYQDENGEWVWYNSPQYSDCLVIKGRSVPERLKTVVVSSDRGIGDNAFYWDFKDFCGNGQHNLVPIILSIQSSRSLGASPVFHRRTG